MEMPQNSLNGSTGKKQSESYPAGNRIPPQALDLEAAILGAIMLEKSAIDQVSDLLSPEMFYSDLNKNIYEAILRLQRANQPVDLLMVLQELLKSEKGIDAHYLTTLTNRVVSAANIKSHAKIVVQKFLQREIIRTCGELISEAFQTGIDAFELIDLAEEKILAIGRRMGTEGIVGMDSALAMTLTKIDQWRQMDSGVTGISSGFPSIDRATRGWQPENLVIIAARPSVGKSALAKCLVVNAAGKGMPCAIFSLEMGIVDLALRMLASESDINLHSIQTGRLDDEQMGRIYSQGVKKLSKHKIYFDATSNLSIGSFGARARRLVSKQKVGLIVVDYLQLMSGREKGNREQEVSSISRGLKLLAKELGIPIIALSQLSREIEKRQGKKRIPQLSDLRESGGIEQDADVVMFLWAPEDEEIAEDISLSSRIYAKIAKQRNGMLLTVDLDFKKETQLFTEESFGAGTWRPIEGVDPNLFTESKKTE